MAKNKKKRILIVGLPLFAKRVQKSLSQFDENNNYLVFNTYYNFWDRLKFLFHIPKADVVYSINGTLSGSKVFDLAFKYNKKIVLHWVGTDVLQAKEQHQNGRYDKRFFNVTHLADAPWLVDELREIGIHAEVRFLSGYQTHKNAPPLPAQFEVLTYIPENKGEFYGKNEIMELAQKMPDVTFKIAGTSSPWVGATANIKFLGWVENLSAEIENSVVCIRYLKHDGMSQFVLESLTLGRHVLYNYKMKGVIHVPALRQMVDALMELKQKFDAGNLELNTVGRQFIENECNEKAVLSDLKNSILS